MNMKMNMDMNMNRNLKMCGGRHGRGQGHEKFVELNQIKTK
jgi:hypothetical protein